MDAVMIISPSEAEQQHCRWDFFESSYSTFLYLDVSVKEPNELRSTYFLPNRSGTKMY